MPSEDTGKYLRRATLTSLYCNIVLVLIKITMLILMNSLAVAIDLGISVIGLSISIVLFYSIKLASRPADIFHNYGYGKVEHVCEAIEGIVLIGIALGMSSQALLHILNPKPVGFPLFGVIASAVNAVINFGGASYILLMGEKTRSPAIKAEGLHYRLEGVISAIISAAFLLVILIQTTPYAALASYFDPVAALLVSVIIIIPSFKLAKNSFFKLLDSSVEESSQIEILKQLSRYIDKFCEFKDLKTRTSGRNRFIEFRLVVPGEMDIKKGYEGIVELESGIKEGIPDSEVFIMMEPCEKDCDHVRSGKKCPYL